MFAASRTGPRGLAAREALPRRAVPLAGRSSGRRLSPQHAGKGLNRHDAAPMLLRSAVILPIEIYTPEREIDLAEAELAARITAMKGEVNHVPRSASKKPPRPCRPPQQCGCLGEPVPRTATPHPHDGAVAARSSSFWTSRAQREGAQPCADSDNRLALAPRRLARVMYHARRQRCGEISWRRDRRTRFTGTTTAARSI